MSFSESVNFLYCSIWLNLTRHHSDTDSLLPSFTYKDPCDYIGLTQKTIISSSQGDLTSKFNSICYVNSYLLYYVTYSHVLGVDMDIFKEQLFCPQNTYPVSLINQQQNKHKET